MRGEMGAGRPVSPSKKLLRKAEVFGLPTRATADHWLIPVPLTTKRLSPRLSDGTRRCFETSVFRDTYHAPPGSRGMFPAMATLCGSPDTINNARGRQVEAAGAHGHEKMHKNTAKLEALRTGLAFSEAGRVEEEVGGWGVEKRRSVQGKLRRKGAKRAAMQRARQRHAAPRMVPFKDTLAALPEAGRPAHLEELLRQYVTEAAALQPRDLDAVLETLSLEADAVQIRASMVLLRHGFYFSIIKIVHTNGAMLGKVLADMKLMLLTGPGAADWEAAADLWSWHPADRDLFVKQFQGLKIISHYRHFRKQLLGMRRQGACALARIEREMLLKVVNDFSIQLEVQPQGGATRVVGTRSPQASLSEIPSDGTWTATQETGFTSETADFYPSTAEATPSRSPNLQNNLAMGVRDGGGPVPSPKLHSDSAMAVHEAGGAVPGRHQSGRRKGGGAESDAAGTAKENGECDRVVGASASVDEAASEVKFLYGKAPPHGGPSTSASQGTMMTESGCAADRDEISGNAARDSQGREARHGPSQVFPASENAAEGSPEQEGQSSGLDAELPSSCLSAGVVSKVGAENPEVGIYPQDTEVPQRSHDATHPDASGQATQPPSPGYQNLSQDHQVEETAQQANLSAQEQMGRNAPCEAEAGSLNAQVVGDASTPAGEDPQSEELPASAQIHGRDAAAVSEGSEPSAAPHLAERTHASAEEGAERCGDQRAQPDAGGTGEGSHTNVSQADLAGMSQSNGPAELQVGMRLSHSGNVRLDVLEKPESLRQIGSDLVDDGHAHVEGACTGEILNAGVPMEGNGDQTQVSGVGETSAIQAEYGEVSGARKAAHYGSSTGGVPEGVSCSATNGPGEGPAATHRSDQHGGDDQQLSPGTSKGAEAVDVAFTLGKRGSVHLQVSSSSRALAGHPSEDKVVASRPAGMSDAGTLNDGALGMKGTAFAQGYLAGGEQEVTRLAKHSADNEAGVQFDAASSNEGSAASNRESTDGTQAARESADGSKLDVVAIGEQSQGRDGNSNDPAPRDGESVEVGFRLGKRESVHLQVSPTASQMGRNQSGDAPDSTSPVDTRDGGHESEAVSMNEQPPGRDQELINAASRDGESVDVGFTSGKPESTHLQLCPSSRHLGRNLSTNAADSTAPERLSASECGNKPDGVAASEQPTDRDQELNDAMSRDGESVDVGFTIGKRESVHLHVSPSFKRLQGLRSSDAPDSNSPEHLRAGESGAFAISEQHPGRDRESNEATSRDAESVDVGFTLGKRESVHIQVSPSSKHLAINQSNDAADSCASEPLRAGECGNELGPVATNHQSSARDPEPMGAMSNDDERVDIGFTLGKRGSVHLQMSPSSKLLGMDQSHDAGDATGPNHSSASECVNESGATTINGQSSGRDNRQMSDAISGDGESVAVEFALGKRESVHLRVSPTSRSLSGGFESGKVPSNEAAAHGRGAIGAAPGAEEAVVVGFELGKRESVHLQVSPSAKSLARPQPDGAPNRVGVSETPDAGGRKSSAARAQFEPHAALVGSESDKTSLEPEPQVSGTEGENAESEMAVAEDVEMSNERSCPQGQDSLGMQPLPNREGERASGADQVVSQSSQCLKSEGPAEESMAVPAVEGPGSSEATSETGIHKSVTVQERQQADNKEGESEVQGPNADLMDKPGQSDGQSNAPALDGEVAEGESRAEGKWNSVAETSDRKSSDDPIVEKEPEIADSSSGGRENEGSGASGEPPAPRADIPQNQSEGEIVAERNGEPPNSNTEAGQDVQSRTAGDAVTEAQLAGGRGGGCSAGIDVHRSGDVFIEKIEELRAAYETEKKKFGDVTDESLLHQNEKLQKKLQEHEEKQRLLQEEKERMEIEITDTLRAFKEHLAQAQGLAAAMHSRDSDSDEPGGPTAGVTDETRTKIAALGETLKQSPHLEADEAPTEEEIREYAEYLGMDPVEDEGLLYIAEWALTAPLPEGWTVHLDSEGNEFFHNVVTHVSMYEHPMDEQYREYYLQVKAKTRAERDGGGA